MSPANFNDNNWHLRHITIVLVVLLNACSVSSETQALIDTYNSTIPTCTEGADCVTKWEAARSWVVSTASYAIRVSNEDRIETYNADSTRAGTAVQVTREPIGEGQYRLIVNIDCFAISRCPPYWETLIDFNHSVASAGQE